MQNQKNFEKQLLYGKEFEDKFSRWLILRGWYVTPKYLFNGKGAPLLIGKSNKFAIPDLDIAKNGKRLWIECKRKKRMFKHPATGYPLSNHHCYKKVQEITGDKVFIVFEDDTNSIIELYGNYIDKLDNHIYIPKHHRKSDNQISWYFDNKEHITFRYPDAFEFISI